MVTIVSDSRQKAGQHKNKTDYWDSIGQKWITSKLPAGDYALLTDMSTVIDTKKGLSEVASNLIQDHVRFRKEADFCVENGIKLIVLVEEPGIKTVSDVAKWRNPRWLYWHKVKNAHEYGRMLNVRVPDRPPISSPTLMKVMATMARDHGVRWEFCDPKDSGRKILELLGAENV